MSKGEKKRSDRMVSAAELRLAAWIAAEDISLRKTDTLVPVLKKSFGDSATAKLVEMKQTKLTGIVKNVIGSYGEDTLASDFNNCRRKHGQIKYEVLSCFSEVCRR
jgi:hypothetical protein